MRLESGSIELKREWVEIGDVIGTALSRLARSLSQHQVVVEVEPDLPLLRLDFVLIEHVLVNLLENAAKYSPPHTAIRISARLDAQGVAVEVADEGMGIPASARERIFDKFYRVQRGDRQGAGTGLGLSICKGIVEAHGGQIRATSPVHGSGAVLTLTFPVEQDVPTMTAR
jgi:two-component system sensor histidine kinase KdpD